MAVQCKRCLLQERDDKGYYQSVLRYRRTLPQKEKTPDEEYARRLGCCKACDDLQSGVCAQCGCYVEMRAAALRMRCPMGRGW